VDELQRVHRETLIVPVGPLMKGTETESVIADLDGSRGADPILTVRG